MQEAGQLLDIADCDAAVRQQEGAVEESGEIRVGPFGLRRLGLCQEMHFEESPLSSNPNSHVGVAAGRGRRLQSEEDWNSAGRSPVQHGVIHVDVDSGDLHGAPHARNRCGHR
jgi:hypothetical protein